MPFKEISSGSDYGLNQVYIEYNRSSEYYHLVKEHL